LGNVSYPVLFDPPATPRLRLVSAGTDPSGDGRCCGTQFSWDWDKGTANFTSEGLNQIAAPLIIDQDAQRYEQFAAFVIAALLGAALGAAPQVISYTTDRWRELQIDTQRDGGTWGLTNERKCPKTIRGSSRSARPQALPTPCSEC
jgi:hypothetical protein